MILFQDLARMLNETKKSGDECERLGYRTWVDFLLALSEENIHMSHHEFQGENVLRHRLSAYGINIDLLPLEFDNWRCGFSEFDRFYLEYLQSELDLFMSINLIFKKEKNGDVSGFVIVEDHEGMFEISPIGSSEKPHSFKQGFKIMGDEGNRTLQTFQI